MGVESKSRLNPDKLETEATLRAKLTKTTGTGNKMNLP